MTSTKEKAQSSEPVGSTWPMLIIAWAWAGIPLIWGVVQTLHKAAALF